MTRKYSNRLITPLPVKRKYLNLTESITIGFFIGTSLLVGRLFDLENPYWVPISCAAIMQGVSVSHIWQRSFHRIVGTAIGVGLTWLLLELNLSLLSICIAILILQFIIEMLVVRHYALAVIFITPLTFFLAELGQGIGTNPEQLISARFVDIIIGSLIGIVGGWILHNQQVHLKAERQIRKTRVAVLRR